MQDQVWNIIPQICIEKLINFELSSQIYIRIRELDNLLKNHRLIIINNKKLESLQNYGLN